MQIKLDLYQIINALYPCISLRRDGLSCFSRYKYNYYIDVRVKSIYAVFGVLCIYPLHAVNYDVFQIARDLEQ